MLKRLWLIFGPVLLAVLMVGVVILITPVKTVHNYQQEKSAAVALSSNVFKSQQLKKQALSDTKHRFVPFFGSSEWDRMDSFHPSVLAEAYNRSYRPFLLGQRGAQSLTQYYGMQQILPELKGKQAIYFVSPQWFVPQGEDPNAFHLYYTEGQALIFLQNAKNTAADKYAAKRLLKMNISPDINGLVAKVAAGQKLSGADLDRVDLLLGFQAHEDAFFSKFTTSNNFAKRVAPKAKKLPQPFDYAALSGLADKYAEKHTSSNGFGIDNEFYQSRIGKRLPKLAGSQTQMNYVQSPEYGDLQLVLSEFAAQDTDVLFVIPPVNSKWVAYTGLNTAMYQQAVTKIKQQLTSQGFNNIADFSKDGDKQYFMQDTIHMGWNGWLAFDQRVNAFLTTPQTTTPTYKLDDKYFTKDWANADK
jgi:D-alanine transfer protein